MTKVIAKNRAIERNRMTRAEMQVLDAQDDDSDWMERSRHWDQSRTAEIDRRLKRRRLQNPLILAGQGVSLRVEAATLLIRNGFTHYPQKQEIYRYFKADP